MMIRIAIIFSIVCCVSGQLTRAQNYIPIPADSTSEWRIRTKHVITNVPYYYEISDFRYFFSGDTLLSGSTYHKLYYSGLHWYSNNPGNTQVYEKVYYMGIRNGNGKVYAKYIPEIAEELLYDFTLQVGDTFSGFSTLGFTQMITAIDTVLIGNRMHRRFYLSSNATWPDLCASYMIEGIGSEYGLTENMCASTVAGSLFCCYAEQHVPLLYPAGIPSACNLDVGLPRYEEDLDIQLFPNPAQTGLSVKFPVNWSREKTIEVKIYNLLGQIKYQQFVYDKPEITIDVNSLKSGLYLILFKSDTKTFLTKFQLVH